MAMRHRLVVYQPTGSTATERETSTPLHTGAWSTLPLSCCAKSKLIPPHDNDFYEGDGAQVVLGLLFLVPEITRKYHH